MSRLARALPWVALLAMAAALCLQLISTWDYWWMLRTGRLIAETGSVPRFDVYTWTAPGARWVDIHWLYQLALWGVFRIGGHEGVVLVHFALVAAVLALLAPIGRRPGRAFVSVGALALLLLASCGRFMPRPELASWVLLAAVVSLLDRFERRGDAWIWAVVPLQALWVNLHGLFALGIALVSMHLLGELARPLGHAARRMRWGRVRGLAGVTACSTLAALANPNGLDGALYPLQQLRMVSAVGSRGFFGQSVIELQPTFGSLHPVLLMCFLALAGLSAVALASRWRDFPVTDLLQWAAFLYLAIGAQRNVPLFAIVAAPMLVRYANEWLDARPPSPRRSNRLGVLLSTVLLVVAADAARGGFYPRLEMTRTPGLGIDWWRYPVAAADRLAAAPPSGPLAHSMLHGGYLIWRLYPDVPVMLDGRLEVFGPQRFAALRFDSPRSFEALDARFHFGAVVQMHNDPAARSLFEYWKLHPEWRLAAVDDCAALFVRVRPGEASPYPEIDLDAPDLFPPIDGSHRRRDEFRFLYRAIFLTAMDRPDLAAEVWDRALELFPDIEGRKVVRR